MSTGNQRSWWVKEPPPPPPASRLRGVAYYRHSAKDRQENSVAIQQELVQKWARENGVEIVHEFADRGKSGLTAEGRDGFNDMMENWVRKRSDFEFVLCLDVSRCDLRRGEDHQAEFGSGRRPTFPLCPSACCHRSSG